MSSPRSQKADTDRSRPEAESLPPKLAPEAFAIIEGEAQKLVSFGIPTRFSERFLPAMLREVGDELLIPAIAPVIAGIKQSFPELGGIIQEAHNKALATTPEENKWETLLSNFEWIVEAAEDLILPDAVVLVQEGESNLRPLLLSESDDVRLVLLPIASDRLLVGRRGDAFFDQSRFNREAAAASENFFIAARPFRDGTLSDLIGAGPMAYLSEAISSVLEDRFVYQNRSNKLQVGPGEFVQPEETFRFSVTLADFGDQELAEKLNEVIRVMVSIASEQTPLQNLDGITIAADYESALANLDRGDPNLAPENSQALGGQKGVAKQVTVMRNGTYREHVVLWAGHAAGWLSTDERQRSECLYLLYKMLVGVGNTTKYGKAPALDFSSDPVLARMYPYASAAPLSYLSARSAAYVAPHWGGQYADLVIESLEFAEQEIATERALMADSSDVTRISHKGSKCVSSALQHAANWLGHRDGLPDGSVFPGSNLPARLRERGLDLWIELFGRDLAGCFGADGGLNLDMLKVLSRHMERLLWSQGLYCWPKGDQVWCMVIDHKIKPRDF